MQRNTQVLLGVLLLVVVGIVLVVTRATRERARMPAAPKAAVSAVASVTKPVASVESNVTSAVEAALAPEGDGGEDAFDTLPDGGKVPPLPDSAPQSVTFGVIQFTYEGAQFASKGARTKEQARQRAQSVVELAQKDFHAAVAKGDRGSTSNVGRIPRGILEPAIEYVLFTLPKGTVHGEPIDTPRGFWVVRRID